MLYSWFEFNEKSKVELPTIAIISFWFCMIALNENAKWLPGYVTVFGKTRII